MTDLFIAPDAHGTPTLWLRDPERPVMRRMPFVNDGFDAIAALLAERDRLAKMVDAAEVSVVRYAKNAEAHADEVERLTATVARAGEFLRTLTLMDDNATVVHKSGIEYPLDDVIQGLSAALADPEEGERDE